MLERDDGRAEHERLDESKYMKGFGEDTGESDQVSG